MEEKKISPIKSITCDPEALENGDLYITMSAFHKDMENPRSASIKITPDNQNYKHIGEKLASFSQAMVRTLIHVGIMELGGKPYKIIHFGK